MAGNEIIPPGKAAKSSQENSAGAAIAEVYGPVGTASGSKPSVDVTPPPSSGNAPGAENVQERARRELAVIDPARQSGGDPLERWNSGVYGALPSRESTGLSPAESRAARAAMEQNMQAASSDQTPPEILRNLSKSASDTVREAVAANQHTPPDVLARLAKDDDVDTRVAAAGNEKTPKNALIKLATDPDQNVLESLAQNDAAPADALRRLAEYKGNEEEYDESVRMHVAANPSTPSDVLAILASPDQPLDIRGFAAHNHNADAQLLDSLASDPEPSIRIAVADNLSAPPAVLARLLSDPAPYVREAAYKASFGINFKAAAERESDPDKAKALLQADTKLEDPEFRAQFERRSGETSGRGSGTLLSIGILGTAAFDAAAQLNSSDRNSPYDLPRLNLQHD